MRKIPSAPPPADFPSPADHPRKWAAEQEPTEMPQFSRENPVSFASTEAQGVAAALRRHLVACTAIMLLAGGAAAGAIAISTKEYQATATISLENSRLQSTPTQPAFAPAVVDL